ncbi:TatD family hydrolase [Tissierella sp. Yu-01]|uniref:TatD family hydrolase n=1 Tax=Tissierella sp. Yu-01 TaxID=3035694 RepID=UPI00240DF961|nr:TatD family hydrolase [Tissierella sp. Yu-01]WFA08503.1 TatD family hydrolase [Tissierella sp. Yu-01]
MFIDSHAHLDDERFDGDRDNLINSLKDNKIDLVFNIGADIESSKASVELANKYENIYAVVGVHPHDAKDVDKNYLETLRELSKKEKVVAIGEIGLDYYYDNSPRDIQRKAFKEQLNLAKELDLPVVIHTRDAMQETFDILKEAAQDGKLRGIMHCYSGSVEMAMEYIKLGFYISLGGPVTFKKSKVAKEVAVAVPFDKLLIETDSPYLTPEPYRGKRNEPMFVRYTAEMIAELRGISVEELAKATSNNAKAIFGIK